MADFPIHAYLSYRCAIPRDIQDRDKLATICAEPDKGICLIYDQTGTEDGDSLVKFMDELSSARCIFVFLSPEYFQSAYTMYELISMNEWIEQNELDARFILFIRLCDAIVDKFRTEAKDYWYSETKDSAANRYKLADMLKCSNDADVLWSRINTAWETLIKPYLDELHISLESGDPDNMLGVLVDSSRQKIETVIEESTQRLHDKVTVEIERILKPQHIPSRQLAELLKLDQAAMPRDIAKCLAQTASVGTSLDALFKLSKQQEKQLTSRHGEWAQYLYDVEQICGWLLLNTVDPYWWFHNELNMKRMVSKGITGAFQLELPAYIEVIISRNLLQQAQYSLDEYGEIKPDSEERDVTLFDALSTNASDIELLSPIYMDLRRADRAPQDVNKLLQSIELTVRALSDAREGKPIYYIVSQDYLKVLNDRPWFSETESKLAGCLQFICCNAGQGSHDRSPCPDQSLLLEKMANILRLRNPKRTAHG